MYISIEITQFLHSSQIPSFIFYILISFICMYILIEITQFLHSSQIPSFIFYILISFICISIEITKFLHSNRIPSFLHSSPIPKFILITLIYFFIITLIYFFIITLIYFFIITLIYFFIITLIYFFIITLIYFFIITLIYFFIITLIYPKDSTSIEIWLFMKSEGSLEASMAEWLKHPTHNWRSRRFNSYWMHANRNLPPNKLDFCSRMKYYFELSKVYPLQPYHILHRMK